MADDLATRGAALAFFTVLSLSPLLIIFLSLTNFIGISLQEQLFQELKELIGSQAQGVISIILQNVRAHAFAGVFSVIAGILMLIFSGTRMFVQLQGGLNFIWKVEVKPNRQVPIWFMRRFISMMMLAAIFFLLLASLLISALLAFVISKSNPVWDWAAPLGTLLIYTGMIALVFRVLPDVTLRWRDILPGSVCTAVLFDGGKWAIGQYLGIRGIGAAYGAAGSLVVLLLWVYYSSIILYFGMEIIKSYLKYSAQEIKPDPYARWSIWRTREQ